MAELCIIFPFFTVPLSISNNTEHLTTCSGRQDSSAVDSTWSDSVSQVHVVVRCLEFRCRHVGDYDVRWTSILELDQPGRSVSCR